MKKVKLKVGTKLERIMNPGTAYVTGNYEIVDKFKSVTGKSKSLYEVEFTPDETNNFLEKKNWTLLKEDLLKMFNKSE